MGNLVSQWLPARLADRLLAASGIALDARLADMPDAKLRKLGEADQPLGHRARPARRAIARPK